MEIAIIGGGAAGFFAAIMVKKNYSSARVVIFEKSQKLLAKVKISGGGRCNLTNGENSIKELSKAYPRGEKFMKKNLPRWSNKDMMRWFEDRNVPVVIQSDNCVFPQSQNSQSIIDCFVKEARDLDIKIIKGQGVCRLVNVNNAIELHFIHKEEPTQIFDKVILATGGSPRKKGLVWLENMGHIIEDPVPSLFTFNMPKESIRSLMGVVVEKTMVSIQGTKLKSDGPLLITHWGMSGPAILKLSAFGARILSESNYNFKIQVNWVNLKNNDQVKNDLQEIIEANQNKRLSNHRPYALPVRLWTFLLEKASFPINKKWSELGKKGINKMVVLLTNDEYHVEGKTTFKEEFVTCGGISLDSIHPQTMESKVCPNLYFAGELLDIDGITGGYNFQAAWTTAYVAAELK